MPLPIPTYDDLEAQVLAFFRNRFPGRDTHEESFLGKLARAIARSLASFVVSVQNADNDALPTSSTSSAALDVMAVIFGLPADTLGNYGRRGASTATGGAAQCTGTNGTPFPDGTLLNAPDGTTQIKISGTVTIPGIPPGTGGVGGIFVAVTPGTAGNLAAGTVLTWNPAPSGADGTVTLTSALTGAVDRETDAALLARILARLQSAPKGGTASDFRAWAESVTGVLRAYVYPRKRGSGTVDVLITAGGSGVGRKPSGAVQTATSNYINGDGVTQEGKRPVVGEPDTIDLPYLAANGLKIRIRIVAQNLLAYRFDWALGASTLSVASYVAGVITTNEPLPLSLTTAIDAYKAAPATVQAPRLQVMATALPSPGIAVPVAIVDYNAGLKTLTMASVPGTWSIPIANDLIYPYGGAVPLVAQGATPVTAIRGVQGYVDGLGPSRASGYANPLDVWNDTCSIFTLGQVALDTLDADGVTKPVARVLAVTINGTAVDVQASDTVANGIELLYCGQIAVTD